MSYDTIDLRGTFENTKSIGFNHLDAFCEKIDNSISAKAINISCKIDSANNTITIADNGIGMNIRGLRECCTINNRKESTSDAHGRFGIGGQVADIILTDLGPVHMISKPKDDANLYEMNVNYNITKNDDYQLNPHEASRKTEELWERSAIDTTSGTIQVLQSTSDIIPSLSDKINDPNILTSYRFQFGCKYNKQLRNGLVMKFDIDNNSHKIMPIDRLRFDKTVSTCKQKIIIKVHRLPNKSYRFYYPDEKNAKSQYWDYSHSKRGKIVTESPDNTKTVYIGDITLQSTYNEDWVKCLEPELHSMGIKTIGNQVDLKAILGGTIYERNDKMLAQFPSSQTGLSASLIPYYQNSHHNVSFDANETLDSLFGVLVNKSNLVNINIYPDLFSTITALCNKFANKMHTNAQKSAVLLSTYVAPKPNVPTSASGSKSVVSKAVVPTSAGGSKANAPTPAVVAPKTVAPTSVVGPSTVIATPKTPAHTSAVLPMAPPTSAVLPMANPLPITRNNIIFNKNQTHLLITHNQQTIHEIRYTGQYRITEQYYTEMLTHLGEERFLEWLTKSREIGQFACNETYFKP